MSVMHGFAALFTGKGKVYPETLSTQARAEGRRLVWRFYTLNGISIAFLMDNILILYAIRNGVSDPLVAVLSSFVHLTMPFMIVGKQIVSRIGAARNWGLGWFFRYVSASFMIYAPFLQGRLPQKAVSMIILVSAFGFALFRSMGAVSTSAIEGEVTTSENRGNFISGNLIRVNLTQILAMIFIILVTRFIDDLWVYQTVIAAACLIGIYTSTVLAQVPESRIPKVSADIPLKKAFRNLWNTRRSRKLLFAWSAGIVSFMMVIPFMMIGVKSGYRISDYEALTFSLIMLAGGMVSSLVNGMISDHVGPRPLLLMNTAGLIIPSLFWALAPEQFIPVYVGIGFFLAGFCKFGIMLGINHYFLSTVDDADRVGSSLFIRIVSGAAAGLSGSVIGGGLLSWLGTNGVAGLDVYRVYFRIILGILVLMMLVVRSLERLNEWPIRSIIGLLFSPRDIYALHVLRRLRNHDSTSEDAKTMQRLGAIGSTIPETELREQLDSPLLSVRVNALQALGRIRFGLDTEKAVLNQLIYGEHTTAWIAAEITGKHGIRRGIPYLRKGLYSEDHYLQGKCMVALVRLNDVETYPEIIAIFEESDNPRIIIHGAQALSMMNGTEHLVKILRKSLQPGLPPSVVDEVLTAAASTVGARQQFYQFLQQYNQNKKLGTSMFISDLDVHIFRADDLKFLTDGNLEEKRFRYFIRILKKRSAEADNPAAAAVREILQEIEAVDQVPMKNIFCIALILSLSSQRQTHLPSTAD